MLLLKRNVVTAMRLVALAILFTGLAAVQTEQDVTACHDWLRGEADERELTQSLVELVILETSTRSSLIGGLEITNVHRHLELKVLISGHIVAFDRAKPAERSSDYLRVGTLFENVVKALRSTLDFAVVGGRAMTTAMARGSMLRSAATAIPIGKTSTADTLLVRISVSKFVHK